MNLTNKALLSYKCILINIEKEQSKGVKRIYISQVHKILQYVRY